MDKFKKIIASLLLATIFISAPQTANAAQKQSKVEHRTTREARLALSPLEEAIALRQAEEVKQKLSNSGIATIAKYQTWAFYQRSAPERKELNMTATVLSLVAYCEDGNTDKLVLHINGTENSTFAQSFVFDADGIVSSIPCYIPPGEYKFVIEGSDIKKTNALVYVGTDGSLDK